MKLIIFLFLSTILIAGCKDENQIEVIPNYDKDYLPADAVDKQPVLKEGNQEELISKLTKQLESSKPDKLVLDYKLLIDEKGDLNKVQIVESPGKVFDDLVIKTVKTWKFEPGMKDGNNVKSQIRLKGGPYFTESSSLEITKNDYQTEYDEMPMPIGGMIELSKKVVYPKEAKEAGIEGKVFLQVFIDEEGNVIKTEVLKGAGSGLDEAAIDAVTKTKFTPAKHKGKFIKSKIAIPIVFKLS